MKKEILRKIDSDPFGLKKIDFRKRIPEKSEMFDKKEAETYIKGCDYPESVDDLLLSWEIEHQFNHIGLGKMTILDAMCGPGRLGRELLNLGTSKVVFQDGHETMINHAETQARPIVKPGQRMNAVKSLVEEMPFPDNAFDLIVCHNSTHQLSSIEKLETVTKEFVRVTKPGGFVLIADYQRGTTPEFIDSLNERLFFTKEEIVPLLIPTFTAAFSKQEFNKVCESISGIGSWLVSDAKVPHLSDKMKERVALDAVKGHLKDFSSISLRVLIQKEGIWEEKK